MVTLPNFAQNQPVLKNWPTFGLAPIREII
jgi:hypothetical protein